jgi:DNA-binding NarL/FixJ family response regulator
MNYLLSDDLLFASRIRGVADAHELPLQTLRSSGELLERETPTCVILDLQNPGLEIEAVVKALKAKDIFVVAYGSHVDAATLHQARISGCDVVLPRSKFVEELPTALPGWFGVK